MNGFNNEEATTMLRDIVSRLEYAGFTPLTERLSAFMHKPTDARELGNLLREEVIKADRIRQASRRKERGCIV